MISISMMTRIEEEEEDSTRCFAIHDHLMLMMTMRGEVPALHSLFSSFSSSFPSHHHLSVIAYLSSLSPNLIFLSTHVDITHTHKYIIGKHVHTHSLSLTHTLVLSHTLLSLSLCFPLRLLLLLCLFYFWEGMASAFAPPPSPFPSSSSFSLKASPSSSSPHTGGAGIVSSSSSWLLTSVRFILTLLLVFTTALLLSLLTLVMLRRRYVPRHTTHVKHVFMDYGTSAATAMGVTSFLSTLDMTDGDETFHFKRTKTTKPTETERLTFSEEEEEEGGVKGVSRAMATRSPYRVLQPGDRYDLEVRVRLPESAYNRDVARVGVFMVTVEMMSADGRVAYKSTVPGMMRYRSTLVAMASTLLRLPLLVMGVSSEEQTVRLVMLENVVEKEQTPSAFLRVRIDRNAGGGDDARLPQVAGVTATLSIRLSFLSYVLYHYKVISGVLLTGVGLILLSQAMLVAIATSTFWRMLLDGGRSSDAFTTTTTTTTTTKTPWSPLDSSSDDDGDEEEEDEEEEDGEEKAQERETRGDGRSGGRQDDERAGRASGMSEGAFTNLIGDELYASSSSASEDHSGRRGGVGGMDSGGMRQRRRNETSGHDASTASRPPPNPL